VPRVHTITEEIPILDGDVTQVGAHPELDAVVRRYLRVPFGHLSLQRAGTPSITLLNWTRKPSPVVLTSRPSCAVILGSNSSTRLESRKPQGRYRTAKPALKTSRACPRPTGW
jgi:hypothetical protein